MPGAGGARSAFAAGRTGFGGCFGFRFHGTKAYHSGPRERDATAGLAPRFNRKKRLRYSCHQVLYPKLKKVYCSCSKRCIITAALMKETLQRVSAKIRILFFGGGRIFHLCRNAFRGGEHSPPDFFYWHLETIRCIRFGSIRLLRWQKTADFRCGADSRKEKREERLARSGEKQPYAQRRSAWEALIARRRRKTFVSCRESRACRRTKGRNAINPLKKTVTPTASTGRRL